MRSFSQILEQEKANRNILEIHLTKTSWTNEQGKTEKPKNLTFDDLGEFIFDKLKVSPSECSGFDYTTGRYDSRQIKLKANIDPTKYITTTPILFMQHEITVKKQLNNVTKIVFKNVPLNVPDEEILNLCLCYGEPIDNVIHYEKMFNTRNKGMIGSTRYVEMTFNDGAIFNNFYWMEGPLPGDAGRRITVLHNGQVSQCSNCLRQAGHGCRAGGNGRLCEEQKTPRAKMSSYMEMLKIHHGYTSLKVKHAEYQSRNFPPLHGSVQNRNNMDDDSEACEDDEILPINPLDEKNKRIAELENSLAGLKTEISESDQLKEKLTKANAELSIAKKDIHLSKRKLNHTKKATEQKLVEAISNQEFYREDPHLISVYSATLNVEDFDFEGDTDSPDTITPKSNNFLKAVEDNLDKTDSVQTERYQHIKSQILDIVKARMTRQRTFSTSSSIGSQSSQKRSHPGDLDGKSPTRARTQIPLLKH